MGEPYDILCRTFRHKRMGIAAVVMTQHCVGTIDLINHDCVHFACPSVR